MNASYHERLTILREDAARLLMATGRGRRRTATDTAEHRWCPVGDTSAQLKEGHKNAPHWVVKEANETRLGWRCQDFPMFSSSDRRPERISHARTINISQLANHTRADNPDPTWFRIRVSRKFA